MMKNFPQGLGEAAGDSLVVNAPFVTSGEVYYVHHTGSNLYDGRDRARPRATVASAYGSVSDTDTIICLDGHTETFAAAVTIVKHGITIVGAGSSGGFPTVKLKPPAGAPCFRIQANGTSLRNLKFVPRPSSGGVSAFPQVDLGGTTVSAFTLIKGCYFELDQYDAGAGLLMRGDTTGTAYTLVEGCWFVSVTTTAGQGPLGAILSRLGEGAAPAIFMFRITDTVFDGGVTGYNNFWALDISAASNAFVVQLERITLKNGADIDIGLGGGYANVGTAQGGARLDINWATVTLPP